MSGCGKRLEESDWWIARRIGSFPVQIINNINECWRGGRSRILTGLPCFLRLRLTMGLTPVSFGRSLTKAKPILRCRRSSSASVWSRTIMRWRTQVKKVSTYLSHFLECTHRQSLYKRRTQCLPVVMTEIQHFVSKSRGLGDIERGLSYSWSHQRFDSRRS